MKKETVEIDNKIWIEIPNEICEMYNLTSKMKFSIKAVEKPSSKILVSMICDNPEE